MTRFVDRLAGCGVGLNGTHGRFTGRIRFRGEDGYVRIRASRARGFISPATQGCSEGDPFHGVALDARSGSVSFEADHFRGDPGALFLARARERVDNVRIQRYAIGGTPDADAFTYDHGLTTAHVAPPPDRDEPFSGSADLIASGEWSGSLSVSFPGAPDIALAGAGFAARLGRF